MDAGPLSPALWGSFGEAGRDESVSSSMSECEEGGLVDFFFPKACLKELLSCRNDGQWTVKLWLSELGRGGNQHWGVSVQVPS